MQFPITIGLHRSFLLSICMLGFHGIALLAVLCLSWSVWCLALVAVLLVCSSVWTWRQLEPPLQAVRLHGSGGVDCRLAGENCWQEAEIKPGATVHPLMLVLTMERAERPYRLTLAYGSASADELRQLRLFLRWRAVSAVRDDDVA